MCSYLVLNNQQRTSRARRGRRDTSYLSRYFTIPWKVIIDFFSPVMPKIWLLCVRLYRNWHWDEPSCGYEVCVVMYHQPSAPPGIGGLYMFQWNDDNCETKNNFICKYTAGITQRSFNFCLTWNCCYCRIHFFSPQRSHWILLLHLTPLKQVKKKMIIAFRLMLTFWMFRDW